MADPTRAQGYSPIFHAVGPGKQLPPGAVVQGKPAAAVALRTRQVQPQTAAADEGPSSLTAAPSSDSWRLRDAAVALLRERREGYRVPCAPPYRGGGGGGAAPTTTTISSSSSSNNGSMPLSVHFDVEAAQCRVAAVPATAAAVRRAFYGAATSVLEAMRKAALPNAAAQDASSNASWLQDLPPSLQTESAAANGAAAASISRPTVAQLRSFCLTRAYENKEYAKRKGGKTDANYTPPPPRHAKAKATLTTLPPTAVEALPTPPTSAAPVVAVVGITPQATMAPADVVSTTHGKKAAAMAAAPKFSRNTPACSAAALDFRFNSSRAILCVAGNLAFERLTPPPVLGSGEGVVAWDILDVPQNKKDDATTPPAQLLHAATERVNMGAVLLEAQTLGLRTISHVENAVRRAKLRYQYRKDNVAYGDRRTDGDVARGIEHPFAFRTPPSASEDDDDDDDSSGDDSAIPYRPNPASLTDVWQTSCRPRFLSVLQTGAGHAIYHDVQWSTRHGRLADVLRAHGCGTTTTTPTNFGPHLIVTTAPEVARFAQEFSSVHRLGRLVVRSDDGGGGGGDTRQSWRALAYRGSKRRRRTLRRYFSQATGLADAPFHVLITTYEVFLQDYLHFCQLPFDAVVLDDGVAWMAARDQISPLGTIWDSAIFASNDHHVGLAGTSFKEWDYLQDDIPEAVLREAWIGLTARHRIATASTFALKQRQTTELIPVSGLIDFVAPQFSAAVKEEWDRSKISVDSASMNHFRKLVARSVVVHSWESPVRDLCTLALQALTGKIQSPDRSGDPLVPLVVSDDDFVTIGKVAVSRRCSLQWLGPPSLSWLRYELGCATFQHILDAMKLSNHHGHFCEEITTASSTTSTGATGQVAGSMAYRFAIRCGRHFGSEPGLRQHLSAQHAPPGTWLCRTCSSDCISSQARTHHERVCGHPVNGVLGETGSSVGATPTVGQGASRKSGVGKKKASRPGTLQPGASTLEEKDPDGSFRVPGYRGVWVSKTGSHFVKIDGKRLHQSENCNKLLLFDTADGAAKRHDDVVKQRKSPFIELNFKPDGSRIVYEDITPASTSGLGGSAEKIVPALSVINIKDLPPDVKPLLRDPRQTSRTGGNSKRHIYAYRGVCRQARKGHDRWQSQISFMGVNHYLGTFDSEWDAAAIYAWAHLILYGDEATKLAQKEGEEAAAAYELEKRDIAEGKIPESPAKPDKKKKSLTPRPTGKSSDIDAIPASAASGDEGESTHSKKRKAGPRESLSGDKKARNNCRIPKTEKDLMVLSLSKGVLKAPVIAPRMEFDQMEDSEVLVMAARKLKMARAGAYCASVLTMVPSAVDECLRPCIPGNMETARACLPMGGAMLVGLSPSAFGWDMQEFVEASELSAEQDIMAALQLLAVEYDDEGVNEKFRSVVQGTVCVIGSTGKATQQMYHSLGLGAVPLGGCVGKLDCHIGGVPGSCSERAACIRYSPTENSVFQFVCLSSDDMVTLNGRRITPETGSFPLLNDDVCSVGARVFVFVMPSDDVGGE